MEKEINKLRFYTPYICEDAAREIADLARAINFQSGRKGGTSSCVFVDEYALLYSNVFRKNKIEPAQFQSVMRELHKLYEGGAHVAPILGYVRGEDGVANPNFKPAKYRDLVIVQKAPGRTLNVMRTKKGVDARLMTDHHYDDVIKSFLEIVNSPLNPDFSHDNTLYEPTAGYTFIDFNTLLKNMPKDYLRDCTMKFLKSFITDKKIEGEETKADYFESSDYEQRVLTTKMLKAGVPWAHLDYSIREIAKKIPGVGSSTLDELLR